MSYIAILRLSNEFHSHNVNKRCISFPEISCQVSFSYVLGPNVQYIVAKWSIMFAKKFSEKQRGRREEWKFFRILIFVFE
jgi:hypothetical protein